MVATAEAIEQELSCGPDGFIRRFIADDERSKSQATA